MSLVHGDILWFDGDIFVFNGTTDGIAENDDPLVGHLLDFCDQDAVLTASNDLLKSSHILDMLLINHSVPKDHAHILAFGFLKSKHQGVIEV